MRSSARTSPARRKLAASPGSAHLSRSATLSTDAYEPVALTRRHDDAVLAPPKPTVPTSRDEAVDSVAHWPRNDADHGEPAPWRPKLAQNLHAGIGPG